MARTKKIVRREWTKEDVRQMKTMAKAKAGVAKIAKSLENSGRYERDGCEARHITFYACLSIYRTGLATMASVASHVRVRLFSFAYRLGVLENSSVAAKQTPRGLGAVTQQNLMSAFACITDVGLTTPHVRKVP